MILPERKGEQQNMKKIAAIMLALLIAGISTGAALAYLTAQESVENRLTAASTDIEITEQFDPPEELHPGTVIPKKVAVTSHSSTDCYVRVLVEFSSWKAQQFCEKLEGKGASGRNYRTAVLTGKDSFECGQRRSGEIRNSGLCGSSILWK